MTELIDRLRFEAAEGYTICGEAADEIEHLALDLQTERAAVVALRAEMDATAETSHRLREALQLAIHSCASPSLWLCHAASALEATP